MVVTARNAAEQIITTYSPAGASVHRHLIRAWFQRESPPRSSRRLALFAVLAMLDIKYSAFSDSVV